MSRHVDDPANDRGDETTALEMAEQLGDWRWAAELVPVYGGIRCPKHAREELNAHLAARGLVAIEEPGFKSLLVVTLDDVASDMAVEAA